MWSCYISKLLKISFNNQIINKNPPLDKRLFSQGFEPFEISPNEFCEAVNHGICFSYQFQHGLRNTKNFICTDFICVDMDGGREIKDVLADDIVQKYGSIFYTTASHTLDQHRFRIVFFLPRTISDVNEVRHATRSLAGRLGGDLSVTDGARMFYGSKDSSPELLGKSLTEEYLNELIEDGKVVPQPLRNSSNSNHTSNRSKLRLDVNQTVRTATNETVTLKDIVKKTTIYCPYHPDKNPSSFVSFNKAGVMFHNCSTCNLTRWSKDTNYGYNFNDFEESVIALENKSSSFKKDLLEPHRLQKFSSPSEGNFLVNNVIVQKQKYLAIDEIRDGLTFIKSPKGSGKTHFLEHFVQRFVSSYRSRHEFKKDPEHKNKKYYDKNKRVLLIGHRQSLIGEISNRIGLHSYLDDKNISKNEVIKKKERYGVCLDSLRKVQNDNYDLIIIDEVEQVLAHFLSETIGSKRYQIYELFSRLIRGAKQVVVLDSDISWVAFNTLTSIIEEDQQSEENKSVHIHINQHKAENQVIKLYQYDGQIIEEFKRSVLEGKKVYVSANSKNRIKVLDKMLDDLEKSKKIKIPRLAITSENSKTKEVQKFILSVKTEILKYQVILSSPSLGTGIDITFENDAKEIDHVFGIYETQVNNHFDIDQQLSRVRHPKEISVFVAPRVFGFETELGVVEQDVQNEFLKELSFSNFEINQKSIQPELSSFIRLCSRLVSFSRHSMNKLRINFIKLKEDQGFEIQWVEDDITKSMKGKTSYQNSKKELLEEDISNLLSAQPLNLYDYERCKDRMNYLQLSISHKLKLQYQRTSIEFFYREPVTKELIEQDAAGRFRGEVYRFKSLTNRKDLKIYLQMLSTNNERKFITNSIQEYKLASALLNEILRTTPIFDGIKFLEDIEFTARDLSDFSKASQQVSPFVETQLGILTRKDVRIKPTQHLTQLLKLVGLRIEKTRTGKANGKKSYYYKLDSSKLNRVLEIVNKQMETNSEVELIQRYGAKWIYMNDLYDFQYTQAQLDWLCPGGGFNEDLKRRDTFSGYEKWGFENGFGDN